MPLLLNITKKFIIVYSQSSSSKSGILRHEHAHVHELHATQAHLGIAKASSQIAPNIFAYSTLFALILHFLPIYICNNTTGTRATAITHTTCTL